MAKKTVEQYNAEYSTLLAQLGQNHYFIRRMQRDIDNIMVAIKEKEKENKSFNKQIDDLQEEATKVINKQKVQDLAHQEILDETKEVSEAVNE